MNVCSITSFFEKIWSAQFEVCPLQMKKKNYCASKAEKLPDLPEYFGSVSFRLDLMSIKAFMKNSICGSHITE